MVQVFYKKMEQRVSTMSLMVLQIYLFFLVSRIEGSIDEYMTCDKLNEARNARVLEYIPCDMTKQSYCEYKGFSYPERSIQKFRDDNRGLMRRLYGDVDSNEVYREMRSNNLFEYETPSTRYSDPMQHYSNQRNTRDHGSSSSYSVNMVPFNQNMFDGLHYNIRVGSGFEMVKNAKMEKSEEEKSEDTNKAPIMRSRTRSRTTAGTTQPVTSTTVVTVQTSTSTSYTTSVSSSDVPTQAPTTATATTVQQPQTIQPTTTEFDPVTGTSEGQTVMAFSNTQFPTSQQVVLETEKQTENPTTESQFFEPISSRDGDVHFSTTINFDEENVFDLSSPSSSSSSSDSTSTLNLDEQDLSATETDLYDTEQYDIQEHNEVQELIIEEQGEDVEQLEAEIESINEQEEEEFEEISEYSGESMNACPVYEEVKAPFWANNTRNQVLALLNLYPFEQYIHMERCKDEGEQMLCRPGCRCEQQFRLHRLLAFDPKNECRGIFSDWFRFPSFCLCKCYNVPEQVLATMNRKAKGMKQSPVNKKVSKQKHKQSGKAPALNKNLENHRMSKESKVFMSDGMMYPNSVMPAIFPYEGKAAIMSELNRAAAATQAATLASNTITFKDTLSAETTMTDSIDQDDSQINDDVVKSKMAATEELLEMIELGGQHIDNTVESNLDHFKKNAKEGRQLDDHFFYNNPIVEFKLPDGTMGTVATSPRRKK